MRSLGPWVSIALVAACGRLKFDELGGDGGNGRGDGAVGQTIVYLKASNAEGYDTFGDGLAISRDGTTLVVGASHESSAAQGIGGDQTDNSAASSGAAYVFARVGTTWMQQAYVKASNSETGDRFGAAIALSADGNTLAVSSPSEDSSAIAIDGNQLDNSASGAGAVFVFVRAGATWSQQAYIKASNTDPGDVFGAEVALSDDGNMLAVSATLEASNATGIGGQQNNNAAVGAGAVYVFTRTGTMWSQQAYIKASNTGAGDHFGYAVGLAGDGYTLAVGADDEDSVANVIDGNQLDNSAPSAGAVYIFTRSGTNWAQQAYVKASNADSPDDFGGELSISSDGNVLVVAADSERSASTGIDGNQFDNSAIVAGAAYVFARTGTTWTQQAYIKASNAQANDFFGLGVAMSPDGGRFAVGAPYESSSAVGIDGDQLNNAAFGAGAVYMFERAGASWQQAAYIKASNTDSTDHFGYPLALAGDGTLAVSAWSEASAASGVDADQTDNSAYQTGAVYVYQ